MSKSYDYIIVGAGSSGCALANRLSADARVLLLEAGGPDTSPDIHDPTGVVSAIFGPNGFSVPYATEPQPHLLQPDGTSGRVVQVHRGIVRGGCSSINGMIYVRGNRRDYDHWADLGNEGWSYEEVLPYFKRSEEHDRGASEYHGVGGPLHVRALPSPSEVSHAFVDAAANLPADTGFGPFPGSRYDADINGAQQEDVAAHYDVTATAGGKRASASVAFLDPIRDRDTLTVRIGCRVSRIVIEKGRATGVEVVEDGAPTVYHVDREVVLCAGAFDSPKLLMLSGIGPADHLTDHGIRPVLDLPGVGANLHDHLMMLLYVVVAPGKTPGVSDFIAEAGLFTRTRDDASAPPDLQYHFLAGMRGLAVDPDKEPNFLFCPALIRPESRGSVRLSSTDPGKPPALDPKYLDSDADVEVLVRGIELARALSSTAPLSDYSGGNPLFAVPDPTKPRSMVPEKGRRGLERFVRTNATTVWHPVGTCRMGRDEMAVVDPQLRVHGVGGLRVVDASVMPRITSGNTNAPAIMIAEKAADLVRLGHHRDHDAADTETTAREELRT